MRMAQQEMMCELRCTLISGKRFINQQVLFRGNLPFRDL